MATTAADEVHRVEQEESVQGGNYVGDKGSGYDGGTGSHDGGKGYHDGGKGYHDGGNRYYDGGKGSTHD
eukprot:370719-Pyramimonas_sp.AAC.1